MTARARSDVRLVLLFVALAGAGWLLARQVDRAHAAPIDPVVAADHAAPCLDRAPPPPTVRAPSWWSRQVSTARTLGANTGGAGLVLALGAIVDRVRDWRPRLKRGAIGRLTYGLWAASLWAAASLGTGATWATTLSGVVLALLTGAVWAAVPRRDEASA